MPKYYCDYCDSYLTHDSPSVRKTHFIGRKHRENVRDFYQKWLEEQTQRLIDKTTAAFKTGKVMPKLPGFPPGMPMPPMLPGMPMPPPGMPMPPMLPGMPMPPPGLVPGFPPIRPGLTLPPGMPPGLPPMMMPPMGLPPMGSMPPSLPAPPQPIEPAQQSAE